MHETFSVAHYQQHQLLFTWCIVIPNCSPILLPLITHQSFVRLFFVICFSSLLRTSYCVMLLPIYSYLYNNTKLIVCMCIFRLCKLQFRRRWYLLQQYSPALTCTLPFGGNIQSYFCCTQNTMLILISTSEEAKPDTCYLLNIFILYLFNYLRFENKIKYLLLTRESNSII